MSRNLCITAVDGQTGHLIAELLLTDPNFSKRFKSVAGLALDVEHEHVQQLESLGAAIVPHQPGSERALTKQLKDMGVDTICLIPPTHPDKYDITFELINAARKANIPNVCFISAAGADLADPKKQPRLHEFIALEHLVLASKGDTSTKAGHSPVVIRAGFYAENLLLYAPQIREEHILPLPVGATHKLAPIALGDIAQVAAHVLSGEGPQGFADQHRGQLIVLTGPMLAAGDELATAAGKALGFDVTYENISQAEAKRLLKSHSELDSSEMEFLLEYYSLVREGKTNYISTHAFHDITGTQPTELEEVFKLYAAEFQAQGGDSQDGRVSKRRKTKK
ncbi:hypothetical protein C8F04DRAFT_1037039 [Mycena alexandri]|uniref:NmrA-like domain-containing protein n=1 Tax=Mycena alexandri TaxID=1745969 RepID=A0AAD6X1Y9_9AGAR|nr:hypothetical protein C8F04DRAFT_1037039 [Mycena alexandri]